MKMANTVLGNPIETSDFQDPASNRWQPLVFAFHTVGNSGEPGGFAAVLKVRVAARIL